MPPRPSVVHDTATVSTSRSTIGTDSECRTQLEQTIEHAAHLLPSQGPITVFVHHNTLHSFEEHPFDAAVKQGAVTFGCHPYLPESDYRAKLSAGRILPEDLVAVLIDDLCDDADELIGFMGTRYHLRLAMLEHPLRVGSDAEIRWLMAETDALVRFRAEAPEMFRTQMLQATKRWVMRDLRNGLEGAEHGVRDTVVDLFGKFGKSRIESWSDTVWQAFTLQLLWRICRQGVHGVPRTAGAEPSLLRHGDLLLQTTGHDSDALVNELLIRFCAAFLDQGFANWPLPDRDRGFFRSFLAIYGDSHPIDRWMHALPAELRRIESEGYDSWQSIEESLRLLGLEASERDEYVQQTLLALRGWAGMVWQMETNAEWTVHPAPAGTLVDYLAIRLILERVALRYLVGLHFGGEVSLDHLRSRLRKGLAHAPRVSVDQRAYLVFQLAQVRGWSPADLHRLSTREWSRLVEEIEAFPSLERRRVYHLAFERRYRNQTLDAVLAHCRRQQLHSEQAARADGREHATLPAYQIVCCLDEREESFRRHLEEIDPACETFGVAGFFGVAMYYRGATEAHFRPLCPVNIKPRHFVQEVSVYSLEQSSRRRAEARRALGQAAHQVHVGTRSFVGGVLSGLLGSLATFPLLLRVLFPRAAARTRREFGRIVTPPVTELQLERSEAEPGSGEGHLGFTLEEMAGIVQGVLRAIGLTRRFAPLVVISGHGSSSLNNPHEAAHDCGACGGGRGGPNARAFAQMANDPRVRELLAQEGLVIPDDVCFIGAYHNTCDDSMTYYDLDKLRADHRDVCERARQSLEEARRRNAHERCRRFESADLSLSNEEALQHVEGRAEDLSQVRPEYGHATNALCFVGRRTWSRGLFLDRRTFLTSYDPNQDDADSSILTGLLQAVIPVCAGINLEYYFSFVDATGYGCGTKLPHNITSLLGVMDGAASDLRPGLPWQMVEIHEPVRLLFLVETEPQAMQRIIDENPPIAELVCNEWVQLATLDPVAGEVQLYRDGGFEAYCAENTELPTVHRSVDWYRGQRDHLGYASITTGAHVEPTATGERN